MYNTDSNGPYHSDPNSAFDGEVSEENFFHTDVEEGAWWEVDLGALVNVRRVQIFNRVGSSVQGRLSNADVQLIDNKGRVFDTKNLGNTDRVSQLNVYFDPTIRSPVPSWEYDVSYVEATPHSGECMSANALKVSSCPESIYLLNSILHSFSF